MNTTLVEPKKIDYLMISAGAVSALIIAGTLTNTFAQMGISERSALIALVIAGITMCARGPLGKMEIYGWANPRHLLGYGLGVLALAIAVTQLLNLHLPGIGSDHTAILSIAVVMLVKVLVAASYPRRG